MFDDDFFDEEPGAIEDLLRKFEKIKNGEPGGLLDEDEYEMVIEYYFQTGNEEQALLACEIGRTYFPFSTGILILKAELLTQAQKYGQALKVLDELEQFGKNEIDAVLLRSDILLAQYKYDQAALWLEQNAENFQGSELADLLLELADIYDESEEFDAVFDTLKRVIAVNPRHEEALQKICFWSDFTKRHEESIVLHNQIIEEDPYNVLAWFNLGTAYQGLKKYNESIDAYEYCVAIDDKFEFAYRNMADAHMRLKNYDCALEALQRHLEIAKPEDVIYEAMGYCWEKQKDYPKARHFYRQASQLNPEDDAIFYKIGETYSREKEWEKAAKSYSVALKLNKDNAAYCMAIGNCLMQMDVKTDAIVCYLNAVRLKPNNKSTWVALLKGLYIGGFHEDLLQQVDFAVEFCGNKGEFYYFLAAALLEMGKAKEAMVQLENGLKMAPAKAKMFLDLNPDFLCRTSVTDLVTRYKKK